MSIISIKKAQQAKKILVTKRNLNRSIDWLRNVADIDAPSPEYFTRRRLHPIQFSQG
jgi:hypothetical protein